MQIMQKIESGSELNEAIRRLEEKQADDEIKLKEQFYLAFESIRPINLIKSTFKDSAASRELIDYTTKVSVGLVAGYFIKKSIQGRANNSLRSLFGSALLYVIADAAANHPEAVKSLGRGMLNLLRSKPVNGDGRSSTSGTLNEPAKRILDECAS